MKLIIRIMNLLDGTDVPNDVGKILRNNLFDRKFPKSIDSVSFKVPFSKVKVIDKKLTDTKVLVYENTGQIDESFKDRQYFNYYITEQEQYNNASNPAVISYKVAESTPRYNKITGKSETLKFLVISLHGKILKSDYFEGINQNNLTKVYELLMAQKVVWFPKELFFEAFVTDIDVKFDFLCTDSVAKKLFSALDSNKYKDKLNKVSLFDSKAKKIHNHGIQFGTREATNPIQEPYIKIYKKSEQIRKVHPIFFDEYGLKDKLKEMGETGYISKPFVKTKEEQEQFDNALFLYRCELNIKNQKHLKSLGFSKEQDNTLFNVITFLMVEGTAEDVFKHCFAKWVDLAFPVPDIEKEKKVSKTLSPNDYMTYKLMETTVNSLTKTRTRTRIKNGKQYETVEIIYKPSYADVLKQMLPSPKGNKKFYDRCKKQSDKLYLKLKELEIIPKNDDRIDIENKSIIIDFLN